LNSVNGQWQSDGNPFIEPTLIKSNIDGGIGIFGAMTYSDKVGFKILCN